MTESVYILKKNCVKNLGCLYAKVDAVRNISMQLLDSAQRLKFQRITAQQTQVHLRLS
jgi:hypothetical protein